MSMGLGLPEAGQAWGMHLVVDLTGCDIAFIRDADHIRRFAADLVQLVGMTAYGEPLIERFALDNPAAAGYSLVQLITTSSITAHFAELTGEVFVDLFSCKPFDPDAAARFIANYFVAASYTARVLERGPRRG